jgi:alpha-L-rhamnosidase
VEIPANTTALVYVPASDPGHVREGGKPAASSQGVRLFKQDADQTIFQIGSGRYVFKVAQQHATGGTTK